MQGFIRLIAFFLAAGFFTGTPAGAQLQVTTGGDPEQLVNSVLLGTGVMAMNVTLTGTQVMYGTFGTGANPTNLGITSGLLLTSGSATNAIGPNSSSGITTDCQQPGDPTLDGLIPGYTTHDACVLEFDFIPQGDTISFRYVFGSDEYLEWVGSSYNDVFGFFVSGLDPITYLPFTDKNIAIIPNTANTPVSINNVNNVSNPAYYVDNPQGPMTTIEYDGFTTVLTARCHVIPCMTYHIKLAVADAGDYVLDSGVFLEAGSFNSGGITTNISFTNPNLSALTAIEGCNDAVVTFKLPNPAPDGYVIPFTILASSTAIYGVDYDSIPSPLIIPAGSDSASIIVHAFADGLLEGQETVGLVVPTTICLTDYDTIFFIIEDYFPVQVQTAFADTLVTCGDTIQLTGQVSAGLEPFTYLWSTGSQEYQIMASPVITSQYYITVSDVCGYSSTDSTLVRIAGPWADAGSDTSICAGGSASLTATGGTSYLWSNGMTTSTIAVTPEVTTAYIVTVTDVCSDVDTVTVIVNPLPVVVALTASDSICPGESAMLSAGGADSYLWTSFPADPSLDGQNELPNPVVSPTVSTIYHLQGVDTNTCSNTASVLVVVKPVPSSHFTVSDYNPCVEAATILTYDGNAPPSAHYFWDFDGGLSIGSGMGPYLVYWTEAGEKIISIYVDRDGCLSPVYADTVTVIPRPVALFETDLTEGCEPLEVHFNEYSTQVMPGTVYEWYFGNGEQTLEQDPVYTYNQSGSYSVTLVVSNLYGCNDTLRKNALIHVYPDPLADFSYHPKRVSILDPTVKFNDMSFGQIETWTWDFGDGSTGVLPDISHTYPDTGFYQVILTTRTIHGCVDSASGEVVVMPEHTLFIPNTFTPNHDGHNDIFQAFGTHITDFHMDILNRWGENIFTSDHIDIGWDGTYKGDIAPTGVYTVVITYRDIQGSRHSYYGKVTMLR
ncbi:MAG TPA: choice-of-anchor L domain-containing protein [Bacteroidales bacterium]|nr:choice-of-anchor L domain-containing protein [Bacteroidales bacterium]HSA42968.1 choice-of-anchor L domain-containing protein [Bacteroidales bacterium]